MIFGSVTLLISFLSLQAFSPLSLPDTNSEAVDEERIVVENFNSYPVGSLPTRWNRLDGRRLVPLKKEHLRDTEHISVMEEERRRFVRLSVEGVVSQIILPNGQDYDWNLRSHPRLRWDCRAIEIPSGAREDQSRLNDVAAAVYVTFSVNIFGVPRSIKYTYSSSLPVGTVVRYSGLRVLVVASAKDDFGDWITMDRDVVADYQQIWGGDPPAEPLSITIWSDADSVPGGKAVADFDNIVLLPAL